MPGLVRGQRFGVAPGESQPFCHRPDSLDARPTGLRVGSVSSGPVRSIQGRGIVEQQTNHRAWPRYDVVHHPGSMSSDVVRAEWAVHRRTGLACDAAVGAGVPGRFRVWDEAGLRAVLATDPALGFLSAVSGVTNETVSTAIDHVNMGAWNGAQPTVVASDGLGEAGEALLAAAGFARTGDRILAVSRLESLAMPTAGPHLDVVDARDVDTFLQVLLAGYEVDGAVAAFITAEHQLPVMHRFLVLEQGRPIAAAAMTIEGEVAVLGGASTMRACRGRGAQSRLLEHRLRVAAEAGSTLAVATARPESASAANLRRAGFRIHRYSAWTRS